jgi:hypothetical protein
VSFTNQFEELFELIEKSKKHIASSEIKNKINNLHEAWKSESTEFSETCSSKNAKFIDTRLSSLEEISIRQYFLKRDALGILREVKKILRECELRTIELAGSDSANKQKIRVIKYLSKNKFDSALIFLRKAENRLLKPDYPDVCHQLRLFLEEYLRIYRERKTMKNVRGGTAGDHLKSLSKWLDEGDNRFISGYYGFLCEKGSHSTQSRKNCGPNDAKLALTIIYILVDFLSSKLV